MIRDNASSSSLVRTTVREIIAITPGEWDAILIDRATGEMWRQRITALAAVREYEVVYRNSKEASRSLVGDNVIPLDLADPVDPLEMCDQAEYAGLIPAGADPTDSLYGLCLPENAREGERHA